MKFHEITTSEFPDPDFTPSIAALGWRRPSVFTIPYLAKKFGCRATALQSPEVMEQRVAPRVLSPCPAATRASIVTCWRPCALLARSIRA